MTNTVNKEFNIFMYDTTDDKGNFDLGWWKLNMDNNYQRSYRFCFYGLLEVDEEASNYSHKFTWFYKDDKNKRKHTKRGIDCCSTFWTDFNKTYTVNLINEEEKEVSDSDSEEELVEGVCFGEVETTRCKRFKMEGEREDTCEWNYVVEFDKYGDQVFVYYETILGRKEMELPLMISNDCKRLELACDLQSEEGWSVLYDCGHC